MNRQGFEQPFEYLGPFHFAGQGGIFPVNVGGDAGTFQQDTRSGIEDFFLHLIGKRVHNDLLIYVSGPIRLIDLPSKRSSIPAENTQNRRYLTPC